MSLSSFTLDGVASATQSMNYSSLDRTGANGTSTGTYVLGENSPVSGTGGLTATSWQSSSLADQRAMRMTLHSEGSFPNDYFDASSYALTLFSSDSQSMDLAGQGTQTANGTNIGVSFSDTSLNSFSSHAQQRAQDTQTYDLGDTPEDNDVWTDQSAVSGSFNSTKGSFESWAYDGHGSGFDSFAASGSGAGSYTLSVDGEINGANSFSMDGGSTGSFQQNENGFSGSTTFSHSQQATSTLTLHADGTTTGGYYPSSSLNSYLSQQSSLTTTVDNVGDGNGELDVTSLTTVSGTGTTGTSTAFSQGTYTQGLSVETYVSGPTDGGATLTAPPLLPAVPYLREMEVGAQVVTPAGSPGVLGTGGVGCLAEGFVGSAVGLVASRPSAPTLSGYTPAYLGSANTWRFWVQPQGMQLLSVVLVPPVATPMEVSWVTLAGSGASLPNNSWNAWTWLSTTGQIWSQVSSNYDQAWGQEANATRTSNPLQLSATQTWEQMIPGLVAGGANVSLDGGRRAVEFVAGVANTLTGGLLQTQVGRFLLTGGWSMLLPPSTFTFGGYINSQSSSFQLGGYVGQAVNIALSVWSPGGFLGGAIMALQATQFAGGLAQAGDAALQGRWVAAIDGAKQAGITALVQMGPCVVKSAVGSVFGSASGASAAAWLTRGIILGQVGSSVYQGVQQIGSGDVIGGILQIAQGAASIYSAMRSCFPAGTMLLTDSGPKAIETITFEDRLLSRHEDEPSGPLEYKRILQAFVRVAPIIEVRVAGEVIRTTKEHPFYVLWKGWVPAEFLQEGDLLVSHDGQLLVVEGVTDSGVVTTVYNFEVEDYHTYFVGGDCWQFSVWAHNAKNYVFERSNLPANDPINKSIRRHNRNVAKQSTASQEAKALRAGSKLDPRVTSGIPPNQLVRNAAEYQQTSDFYRNHKQLARRLWEERTARRWPVDANGTPFTADHNDAVGGRRGWADPLEVTPGRGSAARTANDNRTPEEMRATGSLGTPARELNRYLRWLDANGWMIQL